jgi:hypothetical protein
MADLGDDLAIEGPTICNRFRQGAEGVTIGWQSACNIWLASPQENATSIAKGGEQFGAVRLSTWQKRDVESLMNFIRGL